MADKEIACSFSVTFRDKLHFAKVVKWLNNNVGHGKTNWTITGKVLSKMRNGQQVTRTVVVFNKEFDESSALYLSLI